jgi:cathepsin L
LIHPLNRAYLHKSSIYQPFISDIALLTRSQFVKFLSVPSKFSEHTENQLLKIGIMLFPLVVCAASVIFTDQEERSFLCWMRGTNQLFTGSDYQLRFSYFQSNFRYIKDHNSNQRSFTLALNRFAAYSPSEVSALFGFIPDSMRKSTTGSRQKVLSATTEVNWLDSVGPVATQADGCWSDWALVAIGAAESAWKISGKPLPCLSMQNLLDCVTTCSGCKGGNVLLAYEWVLKHQGGYFAEESAYQAHTPGCHWSSVHDPKVRIRWTTQVFEGDEEDLAHVVSTLGPAAAAIDASRPSFLHYKEGVYDEPDCSPLALNHAVLVVGYSASYWILRNSWGEGWGIRGYMHLAKGRGNHCGIATMAVVPSC